MPQTSNPLQVKYALPTHTLHLAVVKHRIPLSALESFPPTRCHPFATHTPSTPHTSNLPLSSHTSPLQSWNAAPSLDHVACVAHVAASVQLLGEVLQPNNASFPLPYVVFRCEGLGRGGASG